MAFAASVPPQTTSPQNHEHQRPRLSVSGHTCALDPLTGKQLWMNEMKGFGTGVASLATVHGSSSAHLLAAAAADAAAAATAATTTTAT